VAFSKCLQDADEFDRGGKLSITRVRHPPMRDRIDRI
jgi:hypothetical protein